MRLLTIGMFTVFAPSVVGAQKPPAVRAIGALQHTSAAPLKSASSALALPGGRVLVNDGIGRRLLLLDSTFTKATVVADTTAATGEGYGTGQSVLIRFRADTALLINPNSLSMFVISPAGAIARVMAVPRPNDAQALYDLTGAPGFDAHGKLVYFNGLGALPGVTMLTAGMQLLVDGKPSDIAKRLMERDPDFLTRRLVDSAMLARADLETRTIDTLGWLKIPKYKREFKLDAQGGLQAIETTPDAIPLVDAWIVLPDGTLAVVRARDYHVDWLDAQGHWSSTPKMPFDWQQLSDTRKESLIDSTVKEWQATFDQVAASRNSGGPGRGGSSGSGGRGGGGGGGGGSGRPSPIAANIAVRPALNDLPAYAPPFELGLHGPALHADADGNIWIRTTTMVQNQPVYDVVNRRGELFDRVQLPSFRTIAGFGPGVIYMAVKGNDGVVHLERAKLR